MSDPKRLLDGGRGPLLAELLAAGANELPSEVTVQRALKRAALAAGAAATLAQSAASHAASSGTALKSAGALSGAAQGAGVSAGAAKVGVSVAALTKWAGIAAVGVGVSSAAPSVVRWLGPASEPARAGESREARAHERAPESRAPPPASFAAKASPAAEPARPPVPSEAAPRSQRPPAKPTASSPRRRAHEELSLVDAAREALQANDAARALATLEPYEAKISERQFELEVGVLRMEAFARLGRMDRARDQARLLLARSPSERQAARARAILDQTSFE